MITGLMYDLKKSEADILDKETRYQIAVHSDDDSRIIRCLSDEELDRFLHTYDLLDFACVDVCGVSGVRRAERIRAGYSRAALLVVADTTVSPSSYVRPSIMPLGVIIRPAGRDQIAPVLEEFMSSCLGNRQISSKKDDSVFVVSGKEGVTKIPYAKIACFEASMKKVFVRMDAEEVSCSDTLDSLETSLPDNFVRCHRGFIINKDRIRQYMASESFLLLDNGMQIPVSRRYKPVIRKILSDK